MMRVWSGGDGRRVCRNESKGVDKKRREGWTGGREIGGGVRFSK